MDREYDLKVRVPVGLAHRADELVPKVQEHPAIIAWGRASRAAIIRLALDMGLRKLEEQYGGEE
jgi:hypothetical protein